METELKIVYAIITIVNKQANEDTKVGERAIRAFLQQYRSALISDYSNQGLEVSEECFQYLGEMPLNLLTNGGREYYADMKKIIRLKDNMGIIVEKNGYAIPVINSEAYNLSLKSLLSKYHPKAKFLTDRLTLYIGKQRTGCAHTDELNELVSEFENEAAGNLKKNITATIHAILDNPSDAPDYDWTTSPYPLNSELITEVKQQVLAREFGIILQIKGDKVTNIDDESIK